MLVAGRRSVDLRIAPSHCTGNSGNRYHAIKAEAREEDADDSPSSASSLCGCIVDSGCTPRIAGNRGRIRHAQHRVPHVGRGGAHQASLETSGTADGWKRGRGPSAFFTRKAKVTGEQPLPRSLGEGSPRAARNERRRRRGRGPPRRRRGLLPATLRNSQADFAIRIFFRHPIAANSAPQPAIRLHLMRDPVNRPLGRPRRELAGPLAFGEFARSRIRSS
jgi:hypothetical protein